MKEITIRIEDSIYDAIENLGDVIREAIEKAYGKSVDVHRKQNIENNIDDTNTWVDDTINSIRGRHPSAICKSCGDSAVYYEWTGYDGERHWNIYHRF